MVTEHNIILVYLSLFMLSDFFLFAFASAVMIKQGGQSHLRSWDSTSHSNSTKQFKGLLVTLLHWTRRHLCRCVKATLNWSYAEALPPVAHRTLCRIFGKQGKRKARWFHALLCRSSRTQNWILQGQQRSGQEQVVIILLKNLWKV